MGIRTLLKRIEQAEKALQARPIFSADCICFPENEPPFFCFPSEEEIGAKVKCPLHGNRFRQPMVHIYVAKWRREGEPKRRQRLSPQYQKAWLASFPEDSVDYARYNENFVLVVTSSCCIRWNSTGYQGRSPWLVSQPLATTDSLAR
jgi:hypothetical protein